MNSCQFAQVGVHMFQLHLHLYITINIYKKKSEISEKFPDREKKGKAVLVCAVGAVSMKYV